MSTTARAALSSIAVGFLALTAFGGSGGNSGGPQSAAQPLAVACTDDAYEPDSSQGSAKPIELGVPQSHQLCDEDWVSFRGGARLEIGLSESPIYAVETRNLTGGADTSIEVSDCFCSGFGETYQVVAADDNGGGGLASRAIYAARPAQFRPLSFPSFVRVREASGSYGGGKGYDVAVSCLTGCPDEVLFVPTAAHSAGLNGTFFQTDLRIVNPRDVETAVDLLFTPTDTDGSTSRVARSVRVGPGGTLALPDVVKELFGVASGSGSIEIRPVGGNVVVTSRTINSAALPGSFGFSASAQPLRDAAGAGQTLHLLQLSKSDLYRTNVGFCEVTGGRTTVRVKMLDASGALLGEKTYDVPPFGHHQVNDVFGALGVPPRSDVRVALEPTSGGARILGFATVIDNRTSDSFLVPGQQAVTDVYFEQLIPASASVDGRFGSRFRTDLRIANVSAAPAEIELRFTPAGQQDPVPSRKYPLAPGQLVALDDVLALFGGTSGTLSIASSAAVPIVTSRTYNLATTGTFGDFVPAQPGLSPGVATITLYGTASFRVNLGLVKVAPGDQITVSLLGRTGQLLASKVYGGIQGSLQINDVFQALGTGPVEDGRLELRGFGFGFRAFATIIDNGSNDFVYVPATGLDKPFDHLTLSLPGGVPLVLERIPAGTASIGSPDDERGRDADETRHDVTLSKPYYMGRTEVTETQWAAVMGQGSRSDRPVANVSWNDINGPGGFLGRLNAHLVATGQTSAGRLRLPTEAEWEVAARAGTATQFFFGNALEDCGEGCGQCPRAEIYLAWCGDRVTPGPDPVGLDGIPANSGTGAFYRTANAYGLVDMHGNVWEWAADWYGPFAAAPATDPTGPASGTERVIRGGGWNSDLRLCRSANRFSYPPGARYDYVGFRLARSSD